MRMRRLSNNVCRRQLRCRETFNVLTLPVRSKLTLRRFVGENTSGQTVETLRRTKGTTIVSIRWELRAGFKRGTGGIGHTAVHLGNFSRDPATTASRVVDHDATAALRRSRPADHIDWLTSIVHFAFAHAQDIRPRRGLKTDREEAYTENEGSTEPTHQC